MATLGPRRLRYSDTKRQDRDKTDNGALELSALPISLRWEATERWKGEKGAYIYRVYFLSSTSSCESLSQ